MQHSQACLKDINAREVQKQIKSLPSIKTAKFNALKENLRMRNTGFGWKKVDIAWSKNCRHYTVNKLTERLIKNINLEDAEGLEIPPHLTIDTSSRIYTVALGTRTVDTGSLDKKYLENEWKLRMTARKLLQRRES